ncbi:hypothetical protein BW723_06350 [Polaribacter reichenbachii]|uniref:ASPIC/UnbV domain-containing protein n=1 Tax=Polaribacter reichenbachii TaxID=996801 RepID=A0A1B8U6A0_9FLAO|nr:VCBS repeat-containing protein [Polaribacter reichenbachii]APZ45935.1 hypothetical protein BW723_06350 [Polaribacter reichenbachii]AUC19797.1 hypothetical protein BTO17_14370 [Polaribacter reichenbachii]OBY67349.1 hypothetical protein LPB301_03140 [Polaribacter reichenbachii]
MKKGIFIFSTILIIACTNTKKEKPLFTIKNAGDTGINFKNSLVENRILNGILYEYFYNGGGVAVADFNGDNLQDVYFVSNLESNKLYLNKGKLKFEDVTDVSKVNGKKGFPTGVTIVDINSDGKQDIYVCKSGNYRNSDDRRNELYVNLGNDKNGNPIFKEDAKKYGLDLPNYSTQATFFDYDKDGDLDMFLINHGARPYESEAISRLMATQSPLQSSRLYQNDKGHYKDVSEESNIINNAISFGLGVAIGDLNNDTWPDVLVGNDFSEKDHLYLNQKDGTFKEVIKEATNHISYFSMGNDISDFNNDGWLDFISVDMMSEHNYDIKTSMSGMNPDRFYGLIDKGLHHQYMYNALQLNNGIPNIENQIPLFSDVAQMNGVSSTDWSWGPLMFDMDNDGWKDIFISNGIKRDFRNNDFIKHKKAKFDAFFSTHGQKTRKNQELARDLTMELINEMPIRNKPNYFFQNKKGKGFVKKNNDWVANYPTSSNGAAYADLDNDGDVDIIVNNTDDFALIYENNSRQLNTNNYIQIKLKGSKKNLNGIGARVILENNNEIQIQENYFSRGFQSAASANLHFGVGGEESIEKITVIWGDGKTKSYKNSKTNQTLILDYNDSKSIDVASKNSKKLFKDITKSSKLIHQHKENYFDDFKRESLLPHKMSQFGPALATSDVNGDGLDDIFIGGAKDSSGKLLIQLNNGTFKEKEISAFKKDKNYEDVGALFFDADSDGDVDLYVVSGGNEYDEGSKFLNDRLYENKGNGNFEITKAISSLGTSGSKVKAADFDKDGDVDLFVGGRQKPGHYPAPTTSFILRNDSELGKIKFTNVTNEIATPLLNIGMVTDAVWVDVDNNSWLDLMIVGEWMSPVLLKNNKGFFENVSEKSGFSKQVGWWFSIESADFDGDGDEDFVAGNLGLNYKYKATEKEPFEVYQKDFDNNGQLDIVLGYYDLGNLYPLRGRQCSSNQMPFIKEKFKDYDSFGEATLIDVYGNTNLKDAIHYKATSFATSYFENNGDGTFTVRPLGNIAQQSSVNAITINDFDNDGNLDMLLAGNLYASEVETPRNDGSIGVFLKGNGKGNFEEISASLSGLYINGDTKNTALISLTGDRKGIVFAKNNNYLQLIKILP